MELSNSDRVASLTYMSRHERAASYRLSEILPPVIDRYRYWMFLGVLLVYLAGFNGQWRIERDSALYLDIGRNWAEGHGATYREQPNHLVFPGLPLLLDATFRVFGTASFLPPLILMSLLGLVTLGLTYRLFLVYADRPTAVVMTVGLGLTKLFYRYCFEILTDLPFLLGVMAFLAGYEAIFHRRAGGSDAEKSTGGKWFDWVLLIAGLGIAISMRPVMWVLIIAIVLTLAWRTLRGELNLQLTAIGVGAVVAVTIFYSMHIGRHSPGVDDYEATVLHRLRDIPALLRQVPDNVIELLPNAALVKAVFGVRFAAHTRVLQIVFTFLNTGLGLLMCALTFTLFRYRALWGFLVACTFALLLLFQQPLDRYFVAVIPLLVFAWWKFLVWVNHKLPANWGNWLFLVLFFSGMGCNLARIGEMVVEQRRRPFLAYYRFGRYESLNRVAKQIVANTQPHDWIVVGPDQARILTLTTGRNAVENTEKAVAIRQRRVFALMGPSWSETKDPRHKETHQEHYEQILRDATQEWLLEHKRTLGPAATAPVRGPYDDWPWILFETEPVH